MRESSLSLSLFFFPLCLSRSLGCYLTLASSGCPQSIPGLFLTLSNAACASLFNLHWLVEDVSVWATSPLGVAVRHVICGFYLLIFFLPVMLPSEIPKFPVDPPVRGFPGVWRLLFHYFLHGTGLHPQLFYLSFYLLYLFLPSFKNNGLPFWVPGVLRQCSEVVLWNFLSVQMIFR